MLRGFGLVVDNTLGVIVASLRDRKARATALSASSIPAFLQMNRQKMPRNEQNPVSRAWR